MAAIFGKFGRLVGRDAALVVVVGVPYETAAGVLEVAKDGADFKSAAGVWRGGVGVDAMVGSGATPVPTVIFRFVELGTVLVAELLVGCADVLFADRAGALELIDFSAGILIRIPPTEDSDEP